MPDTWAEFEKSCQGGRGQEPLKAILTPLKELQRETCTGGQQDTGRHCEAQLDTKGNYTKGKGNYITREYA